MNCCNHCRDSESFFDYKTAQRDLRHYKKKGPKKSTRYLLDGIRSNPIEGYSLLDIGGGIGEIQFELFKSGISNSVHVDASSSYLQTSHGEANRMGLSGVTEYHYGDFVSLESNVPKADIVTLDRVVCCYPDMEKLIDSSVNKARKIYGIVYPRNRIGTKIALWLGNQYFRLRGSSFRTFLHSPEKLDKRIRRHGFQLYSYEETFIWAAATYIRQ